MIIVVMIEEKVEESFLNGYIIIFDRILCPRRNDGGGSGGGGGRQAVSFILSRAFNSSDQK
eukprot:CAMPEP_0113509622 /NCGR_PEP_ID=MMETSP0014_2-20120614/37678_1 /TAXON_ID=2857 /ORGANISM="Nitzschia sp." /LENGTH=60 /DNA_ID=CAMNT_0000405473 /DNA_START=289 /DNA_END=471 /DNA_ORIENTATION=- /assembly_acc=CAM_ASM_000159